MTGKEILDLVERYGFARTQKHFHEFASRQSGEKDLVSLTTGETVPLWEAFSREECRLYTQIAEELNKAIPVNNVYEKKSEILEGHP